MQNPANHLQEIHSAWDVVADWSRRIAFAALIMLAGRIIAGRTKKVVTDACQRANIDATLTPFFEKFAYTSVLLVGMLVALDQLKVSTTSVFALLGAAGIGIGLALQGSLSNFASGVMLIIYRPIRAGDYIEAGGAEGTVTEIGLFMTKLTTRDNKLVLVPNSKVTGDKIVNYSALRIRRVDLEFPVPADAHPLLFRDNIVRTLESDARILSDPEPEVVFSDITPGAAKLAIRPWVKTQDYWAVYRSLQEKLLMHE